MVTVKMTVILMKKQKRVKMSNLHSFFINIKKPHHYEKLPQHP